MVTTMAPHAGTITATGMTTIILMTGTRITPAMITRTIMAMVTATTITMRP